MASSLRLQTHPHGAAQLGASVGYARIRNVATFTQDDRSFILVIILSEHSLTV
jgi:hypothetical protein